MAGRSDLRTFWQALLAGATLLTGCSTTPTAPPAAGESPEAVIGRMYEVHAEFQLQAGGHRYTAGRAASDAGDYYDLVFIDGTLACARQVGVYTSLEEFRNDEYRWQRDYSAWEWVAEADGADYLASKMRESCGLEAPTPVRELPGNQPNEPAEPEVRKDPSTAKEIGGMLVGSMLMTAFLLYGPLFALGGGAYEAALHSELKSESQRILTAVAQPEELVRETLGEPDVRFELPNASTVVLGYDPKADRSLYVGVRDGQVIWVHGEYPWLDQLAGQVAAKK